MKLGIKLAPGNAWKANVEEAHPSMVEIWYNASKPSDYDDMFSYVAKKPMDVGLHYWGALPNGLLTNSSYPDPTITKPSLELMYATIDRAAKHKFAYVNVHPDLYSLLEVNFKTLDVRVASECADIKQSTETFMNHITEMHAYAASKGVVLTVETVPMRDTPTWNPARDRNQVIDIHQMPIDVFVDLSARGIAIANDICHTACNLISQDRTAVMRYVFDMTKRLAPTTRLVHLGYVIAPYNGVDFHDSLDNPVFALDAAVPNKSEMIELLKLFTSRDDVYILVEPKEDHVKNYRLARELLQKAGVLTEKP